MLLVPDRMVTDHFEAPSSAMLQFWIRGSSVAFLLLVYEYAGSSYRALAIFRRGSSWILRVRPKPWISNAFFGTVA